MMTESFDSERATIAVTIAGHNAPGAHTADAVIRYDFIRQEMGWND
jgi:hypothetical protein